MCVFFNTYLLSLVPYFWCRVWEAPGKGGSGSPYPSSGLVLVWFFFFLPFCGIFLFPAVALGTRIPVQAQCHHPFPCPFPGPGTSAFPPVLRAAARHLRLGPSQLPPALVLLVDSV